ncbi:MAG: GNAT family N-acetyltransferase [Jannaschia sp.]
MHPLFDAANALRSAQMEERKPHKRLELEIEPMEILQTDRLDLRRPDAADLPGWETFFTSERASHVGGGPQSTAALAWRVFAVFLGHWDLRGTGPFVLHLRETGEAIGLAGPWYPQGWPARELTWSLWQSRYEGFGLAFESVRAIRQHVAADLGWPQAVSYVASDNASSIKLCQRLGCVENPTLPTPDEDPTRTFVHTWS